MAVNNTGESAFVLKVTCSASDQSVDLLTSMNEVQIVADGDCFVNFDKPVTTTGRFLIKANTPYAFPFPGNVRTIHYLAASATPALYICASKQWLA